MNIKAVMSPSNANHIFNGILGLQQVTRKMLVGENVDLLQGKKKTIPRSCKFTYRGFLKVIATL